MSNNMRIVFMGTPDFAVPSLDILLQNNYNVVGVITVPDKPAGRGQIIHGSAIKKYALEKGIPVYQPQKLKDNEFIKLLKEELKPDLQIVVAFRMLPKEVWQLPKYGTFNLHASLLPQYRGAAPINWAIINGEKQSGITTFFIDEEIDTGQVIYQETMSISENETAGELHDRMMTQGAQLVLKTVQTIATNQLSTTPQNRLIKEQKLHNAPKLTKEIAKINWSNNALTIQNLILGLSPYPAAWTTLINNTNNKKLGLKIFFSKIIPTSHSQTTGSISTDNKSYLKIACNDGYIELLQIQLEGKKIMSVEEFLRGFRFENNWYVE